MFAVILFNAFGALTLGIVKLLADAPLSSMALVTKCQLMVQEMTAIAITSG
ncbi:MAG: hypothetical protein HWE26_17880 [Alteromonadaceae bacterium]|nr:hypothetical protein [Alteromonadaceae bacterium]